MCCLAISHSSATPKNYHAAHPQALLLIETTLYTHWYMKMSTRIVQHVTGHELERRPPAMQDSTGTSRVNHRSDGRDTAQPSAEQQQHQASSALGCGCAV